MNLIGRFPTEITMTAKIVQPSRTRCIDRHPAWGGIVRFKPLVSKGKKTLYPVFIEARTTRRLGKLGTGASHPGGCAGFFGGGGERWEGGEGEN